MTTEKPQENNNMTDEQMKKVLDWLNTKRNTASHVCDFCGNQGWSLAKDIVTSLIVGPTGNINLGGQIYPHVMLICKNCGNTKFFNAAMMELIVLKKAESPDENK